MLVFRKFWCVLFSCDHRFEIRPFALLPITLSRLYLDLKTYLYEYVTLQVSYFSIFQYFTLWKICELYNHVCKYHSLFCLLIFCLQSNSLAERFYIHLNLNQCVYAFKVLKAFLLGFKYSFLVLFILFTTV